MDIPKHEDIVLNPRSFGKQSLIKKFKEFYDHLQLIYPNINSTCEQLYLYMHDLKQPPTCYCGNKLNFLGYNRGYRTYCCEKCAWGDQDRVNQLKLNLLEKYGVEHISQIEQVKEKVKQTCLERYGGRGLQSKEIKNKVTTTNLERYGVENPIESEEIKEKIKQTNLERYDGIGFGSKKISGKIKQTNLERYGVENPIESEEIKEKIKQTNLERYGNEYVIASKSCREKIESSLLEKYGVINPSQIEQVKEKVKQTCLERYGGVGLQSEEIKNKAYSTNLKKYNTINPSKNDDVKKSIIKKFQSKFNVDCGSQVTLFKKYPNLLGISNKTWVMKCPHPECNKCNDKCFKTKAMIYHDRLKNGSEICTNLLPISKSHSSGTTTELFVRSILDEYNIKYECNVRNIISPKELDIYIPSKKIAIECNGIYWHATDKVAKTYHFDKYLKCKEKNIQLLTIWDDQLYSSPDIVKSIILHKLGISNFKIYARKCEIAELDASICTDFLNQNHIQGNCRSKYRYGLYHNNELVAVMTFGVSRVGMGDKTKKIELLRFCAKRCYSVVGAASKLLKHFIKKHNPDQIISYSSNDISNGHLYEQLNFTKSTENLSYWYVNINTKKRYHRFNFTKFKLIELGFSDQMTESEIMKNVGMLKIYDCGQVKWILNIPKNL